jgi:aminopeptidase N
MEEERECISLEYIVPVSYDITMNISKMYDSESTLAWGTVIYEFSVQKSTNVIELNVRGVNVKLVELLGVNPIVPTITFDEEKEVVKFSFTELLPVSNSLKLKIEFESNFCSSLTGQYLSKYRDLEGNPKTIVVTQFESCFCRCVYIFF